MHTDSSASLTYLASRSASECTATVLMPSVRQARWMRRAISPRLAMTIFSIMDIGKLFNDEQVFAELDRLTVLFEDRLDHAGLVGLDLVHHLHGFDDADRIADSDGVAHIDERLGARAR